MWRSNRWEEFFWLSNTIKLADNENDREHHECCELGHLFRLVPLLCTHNITAFDVAPNFYPAAIGVWRSVMPSWAVMAAVCGAEPSEELLLGIQDRAAIKLETLIH